MTATCSGCATPISPRTKSGRCGRCAARDPAVRAKKGKLTPEQRAARAESARALSANPDIVARRSAAGAVTRDQPEARRRHAEACQVAKLARMQDPAFRAKLVEAGHRYGKPNLVPSTPEQRARAGAAIRRKQLAWCPEEFWSLNASLKAKGFRLPERKAIILAEVAGTVEHGRREVERNAFKMRLKHEREQREAY